MRTTVDAERVRAFARALASAAESDATLYLTGGATAVLEGWRAMTIDVDVRLEPEADALFRRIAELKNELDINVELASPPDFIPELPEWRERSPLILTEGRLAVRHFDPYSQALSKIERGFSEDLADVSEMIKRKMVEPAKLRELFEVIEPSLYRYPAIDPAAFRSKVEQALIDAES